LLESSKTCSDLATGILLHQGLFKNMAPIPSLKCQVPTILAYPLGSKIDIPQNPSLLAKNIINFPGKKKKNTMSGGKNGSHLSTKPFLDKPCLTKLLISRQAARCLW